MLTHLLIIYSNRNISLLKDSLLGILSIVSIIFLRKFIRILSMGCLLRRINGMWRKLFIQVKICQNLRMLGKCIWNLIWIMIQESKRKDHMIGISIHPILDLEKSQKTLYITKWNKLLHHNQIRLTSLRLNW